MPYPSNIGYDLRTDQTWYVYPNIIISYTNLVCWNSLSFQVHCYISLMCVHIKMQTGHAIFAPVQHQCDHNPFGYNIPRSHFLCTTASPACPMMSFCILLLSWCLHITKCHHYPLIQIWIWILMWTHIQPTQYTPTWLHTSVTFIPQD